MSWVAIGVAVGGAVLGKQQSDDASDDALGANDSALSESKRQYNQTRRDTKVARETSDSALMTLGYLLGIRQAPSEEGIAGLQSAYDKLKAKKERYAAAVGQGSGGSSRGIGDKGTGTGFGSGTGLAGTMSLLGGKDKGGISPELQAEMSDIEKNLKKAKQKLDSAKKMRGIAAQYSGGIGDFIKQQPGYQFGLDEGNRAVTNNLTAGGQSQGGKALKAAERFGIDYAGSKTDQHLNKLFTLAGYGPAAVGQSAAAGQNLANATAGHAGVVGDVAYGNAATNISGINNVLNTGMSLFSYNNMMNRGGSGTNLATVPQGTPNPNIGATA